MHGVLSESATDQLFEHGFVRSGIRIPEPVLTRIEASYACRPARDSNWSYFLTNCLSKYQRGGSLRAHWERIQLRLNPGKVHRWAQSTLYGKSIFDSSPLLPEVLQACLAAGLNQHLGELPLLVGHDIFLESNSRKRTFGTHRDGFGWDIFYQTGDDLSLYIPLHELSETTGGRLMVERRADRSDRYAGRNRSIKEFSDYCRDHVKLDHRNLVSRQAILDAPKRAVIAREFAIWSGKIDRGFSPPSVLDMAPVDSARGEVILFNNKFFHGVEPWKGQNSRRIYIIRAFPFYDLGLAPPARFLNEAPCNRFVLRGNTNSVEPIDCEREALDFCPMPAY